MDNDGFDVYFKTIFYNSGTAGIIYEENTVVMANDQCRELFEYEPEDMIGKNLFDLVFEEDFGIFEQCCESGVCSKQAGQNDEIRIITRNNKVKNAIIRISSIPNTSKCYISFLDINDQRIIEKALARSQGNFNAITESAIDGIITADSEGNIVYSNPSFRKIFGYSADEILGKSVSVLMPERFRAGFTSKMQHFQQTGEHLLVGKIFESIGLKKNGEEFPFEMSITYWKSGEEKFQTSIVRDITERKEVEKSLKDSEELFKEVFNKVNDIMTLIEIDENGRAGNFIKVNDVAVEKLGYSREEFAKMTPKNIGTSAPGNKEKIVKLVKEGTVTFERNYLTKEGNSIPVEINSHIFDFKGKKVALSVARDISDRKQSEIEIQRLASIVESSEDSIVAYDLDGVILNWNDGAEKVYDYSADEITGENISKLMDPAQVDENLGNIEKIKKGEKVSHFETTRIKKDGTAIDVSVSLSPIKNENGDIIGVSAITRDITEAKKAEEALKASEEKYRRIVEKFIQNALALIGEINKV